MMESLYFVSCHISALVMLMCAFLLLMRRREGNVPRMTLASIYFAMASIAIIRCLGFYNGVSAIEATSMDAILVALFVVTTYALYPARTVFPRIFKGFKKQFLYAPIVVCAIIYVFSLWNGVQFSAFDHGEVFANGKIWQFDVLFRYVVYALSVIIGLLSLYVSLRYSSSKQVRIFAVLAMFFPLLITLRFFICADTYVFGILYQAGSSLIAIYFTYLEIFGDAVVKRVLPKTRGVDSDSAPEDQTVPLVVTATGGVRAMTDEDLESGLATGAVVDSQPVAETSFAADAASSGSVVSDSALWLGLEKYMKTKQPWRNPELRISDLAAMLSTNRTTLANEIHAHGYERFYDYIVKYRLEAFCELVKSSHCGNVKTMFFEVGFRSTSGAFKQFKSLHNMTPRQYMNLHAASKNTDSIG